ncbi:MAG: TonB-dependent receptor [Acidimicrobiia bacterium]|nr:TonB-dependent receptor [Acidimicrobiia bacterium]
MRERGTFMRMLRFQIALAALVLAWLPAAANAQSTVAGSIVGVVRDATGAVLPGVTVEAASPALIEKVRTAVTDGQGQYRLVDLRPGTYSVTFSLAGFGTVVREGLVLTTGLTPTVNAEMKVGAIEETVTVSGASPVVDTTNVRTQTVISRETLDSIPQAKSLGSIAALTLGAILANPADQDVGASRGDAGGASGFTIHGSRSNDSVYLIDGMSMSNMTSQDGAASATTFAPNHMNTEELVIDTAGGNAEFETAGAHINLVPKDGGNVYSSSIRLDGTSSALQADNLGSGLRQRGVVSTPSIKRTYDVGGSFGGPLRRDKLWFFASTRLWSSANYIPNVYYQRTLNARVYEPDTSRQGYADNTNRDWGVRFTWQAAEKHKIAFSDRMQNDCTCFISINGGTQSPEASANVVSWPTNVIQTTWTYPRTSRLLLEAGATFVFLRQDGTRTEGVSPTDIPVTDVAIGFTFNANPGNGGGANYGFDRIRDQWSQRVAMSYVTGSHNFKVGLSMREGHTRETQDPNASAFGPVAFQVRAGVPIQLTQYAAPLAYSYQLRPNLAVYAQDQWTRGRMTLNLGLRVDTNHQQSPAETAEAIPAFGIPARTFPAAKSIPKWRDIAPRAGVAFDLFGTGRTAVKGSFGRYVVQQNSSLSAANAPARRAGLSAVRSWTDANNDFAPNCNLANPLANGECGALSNRTLGLPIPSTTYDTDYLEGFGKREYMWKGMVGLSHELRAGVGVYANYYSTRYGNFTLTTNRALSPADFLTYCITAPTDTRLGSVSGQQVCGLFDVAPAMFGRVDNFVTHSSNFGEQYERYNGMDVSMSARVGNGGLVQGGVSTGRTVTDNCEIVRNNPQIGLAVSGGQGSRSSDRFCHVVRPWSSQTQVKLAANYPLPWWGLGLAGTYQNLPGVPQAANITVTGAQTTLGRLNTATAVALLTPFTMFEERLNQVDIRLTKTLQMAGYRIRGQFDLYNVMNAATVLGVNAAYGANWLRPTSILPARVVKFGAQVDF